MKLLDSNPRTLPEARTIIEAGNAQLTEMENKVVVADQKIIDAEARATKAEEKLAAETKRATDAEAKVADLEGKVTAAEQKAIDAEAKATKAAADADAKVKDFDSKVEATAKTKAGEILAARGLAPLELGMSGGKPEGTELKGTARAAAAFKKQLANS